MTTTTGDHLVLTVEEAAERLKVGRPMMYALVNSGAIESICIGRLRRTLGTRRLATGPGLGRRPGLRVFWRDTGAFIGRRSSNCPPHECGRA